MAIKNVGAMWDKKGSGKAIFSGTFKGTKFLVFKNFNKSDPKHPDYIISETEEYNDENSKQRLP